MDQLLKYNSRKIAALAVCIWAMMQKPEIAVPICVVGSIFIIVQAVVDARKGV